MILTTYNFEIYISALKTSCLHYVKIKLIKFYKSKKIKINVI